MVAFACETYDRINVLSVAGELHQPSIEDLSTHIEVATQSKDVDALIVDCSGLTRIGSSGMRAFCLAQKDLVERGQQLVLVGLSGEVLEAFTIGGIDALLTLCDSVETAMTQCAVDCCEYERAAQ